MHEVIDDTDEDEPETNTLDEATPLLPKSVKARLSKSIQEFMAMLVLWHLLCIARGLFCFWTMQGIAPPEETY